MPQTAAVVSTSADQRAYRLTSIDTLRGLVIVIMAIDHVRDMVMIAALQDPLADPNVSVALFATRWITHFCAPVFVLLAGVSAGLMVARRTPAAVGRLLLTRGLWLIAIECLVVSTSATFSPRGVPEMGGKIVIIMQVIWAIGASMIVLSAAQWLGRRACLLLGLAIIAAHNALDSWWPMSALLDQQWPLWVALHSQMAFVAGPFLFVFVYPVLAWIGVMLFGFGISAVFELPPDRRNGVLLRAGLVMTAAFVVIRGLDLYGDPNGWQTHPAGLTRTVIDFINTTKYPPSLDFLLMTLGPAAVVCALADRWNGSLKEVFMTFGRVPFAFYVVHFYLIHLISVVLGVLQGFSPWQMFTIFFFYPTGYGLPLPGVYAVWLLVIVVLYPFCRRVADIKARRRDWWLSYV